MYFCIDCVLHTQGLVLSHDELKKLKEIASEQREKDIGGLVIGYHIKPTHKNNIK